MLILIPWKPVVVARPAGGDSVGRIRWLFGSGRKRTPLRLRSIIRIGFKHKPSKLAMRTQRSFVVSAEMP
jgi:hypothetical protein